MAANGRELSDREFRRWQDRLLHANEVWKERGLHEPDDPECSAKRLLAYYRGDQADGIRLEGIEAELGVIDNVLFPTVNALVAAVYARNPRVDVSADRPDRKPKAESMEKVVNHLLHSPALRIRREMNRILFDGFTLPFGVARHGFTAQAEKSDAQGNLLETYDPIVPQFPWMKRVAPWDFRCDPLAETLYPEHATWCAFRDLYPMRTIEKSPAFIARENLVPTRTAAGQKRSKREESPDEFELVEVWTVYDKIRRETFRLSPGCSDQAISRARNWPLPWRTLPYSLLQFNPVSDDPIGVSYLELGRPLQDDINRTLTLAIELSRRQRRIVFVNPDIVKEEERKKIENGSLVEMILCSDISQVMKETQVGGNYQELLLLHRLLKEELRAIFGVSDMERGQRINVESSAEAQLVGQGAALQRGRNQGPFEDFLADAIETFARGVQATATEPIVVPIIGVESAQDLLAPGGYWEIPPEEIQGEFQYRIRPGSTLPPDPNADLRREAALNGLLAPFGEIVNMPQRAIDTILAAEKDPSKQLLSTPQLQALIAQNARPTMPGDEAGGGPRPNGAAGQLGIDANMATLLASGGGRTQ